MSINSVMNSGLTALQTSQIALRTTSSNIANVNTDGYHRRDVQFGTQVAGGQLAGVDIAAMQRVVDTFLSRETLSVSTEGGEADILANYLDRLEAYLGAPDSDAMLAARVSSLMGAISQASLDPSSSVRKAAVLSAFNAFADTVARLSDAMQDLRTQTDSEIGGTVARMNTLIAQIADLNPKIQRELLNGNSATGLLDQRDAAIAELATYVDIRTLTQENGKVYVATTSGMTLVGETIAELSYVPNGGVRPSTFFDEIMVQRRAVTSGAAVGPALPLEGELREGKLRGLIDLRSTILPNLADQLGAMASSFADAINAAHNDQSTVPAPASLTGRNTGLLGTDGLNFTGITNLAVTAPDGTLVRRIEIDFDAGTYSVDGGGPVGFSPTLGGFAADINAALAGVGTMDFTDGVMEVSATGGNGVSFLQDSANPSSRGGRGFAHFFGMNDILVADAPTHFDIGLAATDLHGFVNGTTTDFAIRDASGQLVRSFTLTIGGASINDVINDLNTQVGSYGSFALSATGGLTFTPSSTASGWKLEVDSDTTERGATGVSLSSLFGLGTRFGMEQASNMRVRDNVAADSQLIGFAKLDLSVATAVGDVVLAQGDNRGALALAAVEETPRQIRAAGFLAARNASPGEYAATLLADIGRRASEAEVRASDRSALATEIKAKASSVEGVNLDEELANMMLYQQSYNAGARLITAAQRMFDALLEAVN